ncbi:MAG: PRC-barrel domain-containing protein [Rubrobacteraceae bacterium]|nr:PRC-barrel domain-containing protein [Rubrobacteraceae bacterium]MDQ3318160.1 PRC-barrel domain-containing protein [Actinomycetota bacterium]
MEERGLVGLEARTADGTGIGRISEVIVDEDGAITHVLVEREEERFEVPITSLTLDRDADFATFHADASDDEPGDHVGDEERAQGYAPNQSDVDDSEHEGQFVTTPTDPDEAVSLDEEASTEADEAGGWQDEEFTTAESGYPRTDAYIDPDTGEDQVDPLLKENETLKDDVDDLIVDTGLRARRAQDGIVELTGSAATREDLETLVQEIMGLKEVREVDTTDVDVP